MTDDRPWRSDTSPQSLVVRVLCFILELYHASISHALPPACRFYPSCSEYAAGSLRKYGVLRGGARALVRLLKCAPWGRGGIDLP
jgi:putative membrane protein insertion efficiency factor